MIASHLMIDSHLISTATRCNTLQHAAARCSTLQILFESNVMQSHLIWCNHIWYDAISFDMMQSHAITFDMTWLLHIWYRLQHAATRCNTLQIVRMYLNSFSQCIFETVFCIGLWMHFLKMQWMHFLTKKRSQVHSKCFFSNCSHVLGLYFPFANAYTYIQ